MSMSIWVWVYEFEYMSLSIWVYENEYMSVWVYEKLTLTFLAIGCVSAISMPQHNHYIIILFDPWTFRLWHVYGQCGIIATLVSILNSHLSWESGKFQLARWSHSVALLSWNHPPTNQPPTHSPSAYLFFPIVCNLRSWHLVCRVNKWTCKTGQQYEILRPIGPERLTCTQGGDGN